MIRRNLPNIGPGGAAHSMQQSLAHLAAAELLRQALGQSRLARLAELPKGPVQGPGQMKTGDS